MANKTGNNSANTLIGTKAADRLVGRGGNDSLEGQAGNDFLDGGDGIDTLNGGSGADVMIGGRGNDFYFVDSANDSITEKAGAGTGIDTILSSITLSLAKYANVENVTLQGTKNLNVTGSGGKNQLIGNTGANVLRGEGGDDVLDGKVGADKLLGGGGNDVLVWEAGDASVDGGLGDRDSLRLQGGDALDLVTEDTPITGMEIIDLAGTNTLVFAAQEVKDLAPGSTDTVLIRGGEGDVVVGGSGWSYLFNFAEGGQTYAQLTRDGAKVRVDLDVDRSGVQVKDMRVSVLEGTDGFSVSIEPVEEGFYSFNVVASVGDINGDGFDDFIVGVNRSLYEYDYGPPPEFSVTRTNTTFVVFGSDTGFPAGLAASSLDGDNGFRLVGDEDFVAASVSAAGDVNGDGYGDVLIGDDDAEDGAGAVYVVFGAETSSFAASLELSGLDGSNGIKLIGAAAMPYDDVGNVLGAADVNGDGFSDIIMGGPTVDAPGENQGETYVVFGASSTDLADLHGDAGFNISGLNGTNGFVVRGATNNDASGASVSAGDVNGDGRVDLIIGADFLDATGSNSNEGGVHVVFGPPGGFGATVDLASLDGTTGITLYGASKGDRTGSEVSFAGDVNGDGYGDVIVGAFDADSGAANVGTSHVVFGNDDATLGALHGMSLSALDGSNGFTLSGAVKDEGAGTTVSAAGDVNGDGYDDLIVGSYGVTLETKTGGFTFNNYTGASYVIFGASGFASNLSVTSLDGTNGFRVRGLEAYDYTGTSVSGGGDVNGDGFADLVISSAAADGKVGYVILGRNFTDEVTHAGTAAADDLEGTGGGDVMIGGPGDDVLTGNGGKDALRGGAGSDRLEVADTDFLDVDGGSGEDTLAFTGTGVSLVLSSFADTRISGIEAIDLGGLGNALVARPLDVVGLSGTSNTLTVEGGAGDAVELDDGLWTFAGVVDSSYLEFLQGEAVLRVSLAVDAVFGDFVGDDGNNTLDGDGDANLLVGRGGNDTLNGGAGDDILLGGDGADYLYGGAGADTIHVGPNGYSDIVAYRSATDGAAAGANTGYDSVTDPAIIRFEGALGAALNDVAGGNAGQIDFSTNAAVDFSATGAHEGLLLIAGLTNAQLVEDGFAAVLAAINAKGVTSTTGDDGLITAYTADQVGVYYYEELAGDNTVSANELTLLAVTRGLIGMNGFQAE